MGTKHVCESLNQFNDYNFFKLFEKEEKDEKKEKKDTDLKKELQEKEKDGMSIIKKVNDNFKRFQSAAGNKITKYKEFWEENQTMKSNFAEEGNIYKMYDSNYVIGVLSLPDEALEDKTIDSEIETTEEEPVKEAEEFNLDGAEDLSKEENKDQTETTDLEKPVEDTVDGTDLEGGEETTEEKSEESPEFEITDDTSIETKKSSFVVYDMSSGEREEIFRCLSNNVIKAFNEFYENTFKGSMKSIINQYKEKQETIKKEAEEKERVKQEAKKKEKLDKFLGES